MPRFVHILLQCLWGAPQTLLGLLLFILQYRRPHYRYHNAVVTEWQAKASVSLGPFIFLTANAGQHKSRILFHEYGHTVQSLLLGPLYLPAAGLPSVLWAGLPVCKWLRRRKNLSYFSVYPENWADRLGQRVTGESSTAAVQTKL